MENNFEKLELNTLNVSKIFNSCLATNSTKNPLKVSYLSSDAQSKNHHAPEVTFDNDKLLEHHDAIAYMVGQLHAVHAKKDSMNMAYALTNYQQKNWTENKKILFAFAYLSVAAGCLPFFEHNKSGGTICPIGQYKGLKPTYWPPREEREPGDE